MANNGPLSEIKLTSGGPSIPSTQPTQESDSGLSQYFLVLFPEISHSQKSYKPPQFLSLFTADTVGAVPVRLWSWSEKEPPLTAIKS